MDIFESLDQLKKAAGKNPALAQELIATRKQGNSVSSFCSIAAKAGFPIYEMDLITYGEEMYAAMKRSTNGGGENSPVLEGQDDIYEMFIAELEALGRQPQA